MVYKTKVAKTPTKTTKRTPPRSPAKPKLLSTGPLLIDYQELRIYFENSCCSVKDAKGKVVRALTPQQIVQKFPQFDAYNYASFNACVQHFIKKQHSNIQRDRVTGHLMDNLPR